MDFAAIIDWLFPNLVFPMLALLSAFLIYLVNVGIKWVKGKIETDKFDKYFDIAVDTITKAVKSVNQTYVDALKAQGKFDTEAQAIALEKCKEIVKQTMAEGTKEFLSDAIIDFNAWIEATIESLIVDVKNEKAMAMGD